MGRLWNGLLLLGVMMLAASVVNAEPVVETAPTTMTAVLPAAPLAEASAPAQTVVGLPPALPADTLLPVVPSEGSAVSSPVNDGLPSPATSLGAVGQPANAVASIAEPVKVSRLEPGVTPAVAMTAEERQLELRKADFLKFAQVKVVEMNRNHILSRDRMQIQKRPDGGFKASYHQVDDSSLSCQVSRSPTKAAQYVAVLSYKERVYTAACGSPAECRQASFSPSEVIPNRHIFVFKNGVWQ